VKNVKFFYHNLFWRVILPTLLIFPRNNGIGKTPLKQIKEEYQIIFDTKEIIDQEYSNHLISTDLVSLINDRGYNTQTLIKNKVGLSVKNLMNAKRLRESQK